MAKTQTKSLFTADLVVPAIKASFLKLNPRELIRNPVMFVTAVVAALMTVLLVVGQDNLSIGFKLQLVIWLWLTVLFGTFAEAMNAPDELLKEVPGLGEAAITEIKLVRAAALRLVRGEVLERPVLASWSQVVDYCRASMGFEPKDQFRILFLDKKNRLIADEVQQAGTVDHTPVYPREVIKRTLELSATALILVHNHPSGDPAPSSADVQMTRQINDIARPLGITVHDHIIVGRNGHASLKGMKLM